MGLGKDRRVTVNLNGQSEGVWDVMSEKKTTAAPKKYPPGGGRQVPEINLGNSVTHDDVTLERGIDTGLVPGKLHYYRGLIGRQVSMHATDTHLDPDGNVVAEGETAIGEITGAWESGADSKNEDEVMVAITMSVVNYV